MRAAFLTGRPMWFCVEQRACVTCLCSHKLKGLLGNQKGPFEVCLRFSWETQRFSGEGKQRHRHGLAGEPPISAPPTHPDRRWAGGGPNPPANAAASRREAGGRFSEIAYPCTSKPTAVFIRARAACLRSWAQLTHAFLAPLSYFMHCIISKEIVLHEIHDLILTDSISTFIQCIM